MNGSSVEERATPDQPSVYLLTFARTLRNSGPRAGKDRFEYVKQEWGFFGWTDAAFLFARGILY